VDQPFNKNMERRMWTFPPAYFETMKKAVKQRYALLPYIYTQAHLAHESGISLIRPMYYEHPELEIAYEQQQQYYFGENMIVSPITRATGVKAAKQRVWLPAGEWYNFHSNQMMVGDKMVNESFEFDQIPIYVKAGSILPTQKDKLHISKSNLDTLILTIYPDNNGKAAFTLYEDDGISEAYQNGTCFKTAIRFDKMNDQASIVVQPTGVAFEGLPNDRTYVFQIVNSDEPTNIINVDGSEKVIWNFNAATKILSFETTKKTLRDLKLEINY
jgi:alpha-glucosidase (family GH31 glycosyl hydrolase)